MDALYPSDGVEYLSTGAEIVFLEKYKIRAGLPSFTFKNSIEGLTIGIGVIHGISKSTSKIGFDYSLSDFGPLGNVQKIYLNISF